VEIIKAIVLGALQGLTEFLPVSSSGHLVIGSQLLNFQDQGVIFDVFLHLGTLLSVLIVFHRQLRVMVAAPFLKFSGKVTEEVDFYFWWDVYVVLATLPAVVVGLFFKDAIEEVFSSVLVAYCMLIVTGSLMLATRLLPTGQQPMNWWRSILVGCAQACAIMPGLSRSGSTIFAGMALKIPRVKIAEFSFIMSIPAILGAAVLQGGSLLDNPPAASMIVNVAAGTITSAVAGYLAIKLLLDIIGKNRLHWFGYYCYALAAVGLAHYFLTSP